MIEPVDTTVPEGYDTRLLVFRRIRETSEGNLVDVIIRSSDGDELITARFDRGDDLKVTYHTKGAELKKSRPLTIERSTRLTWTRKEAQIIYDAMTRLDHEGLVPYEEMAFFEGVLSKIKSLL